MSVSGMAPQLILMSGFSALPEFLWIKFAISPLPTPDSPVIKIVEFTGLTLSAFSTTLIMEGLLAIILCVFKSANCISSNWYCNWSFKDPCSSSSRCRLSISVISRSLTTTRIIVPSLSRTGVAMEIILRLSFSCKRLTVLFFWMAWRAADWSINPSLMRSTMFLPTNFSAVILCIRSEAGLTRITLALASQTKRPSEEESIIASNSRVRCWKKCICLATFSRAVLSSNRQTAPTCSLSTCMGLMLTRYSCPKK